MSARLTPDQLSLLAAVRIADEDQGGLPWRELDDEARDVAATLLSAGLVEALGDEEDAAFLRITWRGVEIFREHGLRRE